MLDAKSRRRWFGAFCLLAAIVMLALGETALKGRFSALGFVAWWLACMAFTLLAIVAAVLDARALRRESRDEQRALVESTLLEIQEEKARRPAAGRRRPDKA